jgi:3-hydroxyacyl-CoA dehydrogenase
VLADLRAMAGEDPIVWAPSPVIVECARRGIAFADWRK